MINQTQTLSPVFLVILFCIISLGIIQADEKTESKPDQSYWVLFTDKDGVDFDPWAYFDPKAIKRRLRHGQSVYDPINFPVREDYLDSVNTIVEKADVVLRWFNAVHVEATPVQVNKLESLDFVKKVQPVRGGFYPAEKLSGTKESWVLSKEQQDLLKTQTRHMQGQYFSKNGIDGSGVRIAIFDAGFPGVDTHPVFRHIRNDERIVATYDFHNNRQDVFRANVHGTMVMSAVGGMKDSIPMGLATGAEFLLARTELLREIYAEEKYWLAAMEWADRKGADIINSSLGYIYHRYFPDQMDGQTSLVSQAGNIAARKGILVINAAGNERLRENWGTVATPADADSVLAVGALDYPSLLRAAYTSPGPTADGRLKPNLSALGTVVAANRRGFSTPSGTSFASPLVAGFAACLLQMNPDWTSMQLFNALERSGRLYPYFDLAHGYGTPQAGNFLSDAPVFSAPTFDFSENEEEIKVIIRQNVITFPFEDPYDLYVFYHIQNSRGEIEQYYVVRANQHEVLSFRKNDFQPGQKLLVHFKGFTASRVF